MNMGLFLRQVFFKQHELVCDSHAKPNVACVLSLCHVRFLEPAIQRR